MLIKFSDNPFKQVIGIAFYNRVNIALFTVVSILATIQFELASVYNYEAWSLSVIPVTILGGALAIFLGFRNNSAYDRWWEARKIWGGIVNASRSFASLVISFSSQYFSGSTISEEELQQWRQDLIYRHIAWLYSLKMHLRKENYWDHLEKYLSEEDVEQIKSFHNKPAQLIHLQSLQLADGYQEKIIDDFRHVSLGNVIRELYDLQGKAERIKSTIFPYYYNYFTKVFLWVFTLCLPFALVKDMGWTTIPMSIAIAFVFNILEKSGSVTEDPFEGRAADTPISTITRNIEIDLLEMLRSETVPAPLETVTGRFGVRYIE